jgi:hypothetical protein
MRSQPNRSYASNDVVMTPIHLARALTDALQPSGRILEPCAGNGAFVRELERYGQVDVCSQEFPFEWWTKDVDWVITNPPWSQFRTFLDKAMQVSGHVAFLATVNHWWTKRRVSDVRAAGFGYHTLWLCNWPPEFPASGFQLGMMHIARNYDGPLTIRQLEQVK